MLTFLRYTTPGQTRKKKSHLVDVGRKHDKVGIIHFVSSIHDAPKLQQQLVPQLPTPQVSR
jgi:hypothetical protein